MHIIRAQPDADHVSCCLAGGGLNHPLEALDVHNDLIVHAFEGHAGHCPGEMALLRRDNMNVLRTDHHIHRLAVFKSLIQAAEFMAEEADEIIFVHDAVEDIAYGARARAGAGDARGVRGPRRDL